VLRPTAAPAMSVVVLLFKVISISIWQVMIFLVESSLDVEDARILYSLALPAPVAANAVYSVPSRTKAVALYSKSVPSRFIHAALFQALSAQPAPETTT